MTEKVAEKINIIINQKWCKKCGICVSFCPTNVLELDAKIGVIVKDISACINCKLCELRCPDFAIEVIIEGDERENTGS
ncbi:MAG: NAD(P)H-quinone oxidoreductase subunit I, chloroplastic [candidate division WS2 bacterium]|nr:NAD(P)H-quinone oxidoreductase subunit I, chloroplastic [Candidatus Lithacetigena glycinireducens]MBT9174434.1 NAD(P)H-quinone oxidoreductase subunit I, chloroplastic [Candidatus Lithacetigena glycinireducens]